jgi:hypothetical protein
MAGRGKRGVETAKSELRKSSPDLGDAPGATRVPGEGAPLPLFSPSASLEVKRLARVSARLSAQDPLQLGL